MECYLSALFYFHQQGLIFDFLLPQTILEKELFIKNISENVIPETFIVENEEIEVKKEEDINKTHQHVGSTLDLGDQNASLFDKIDFGKDEDLIKKTHSIKKKSSSKKKVSNTVTCAEFQLNLEEKK